MSSARAQVLALLADIKEHPTQDGLRRILADWLDDFGDEVDRARAELIRCQIDYLELPTEAPEKQAAGRQARWLQQKYGPAWLGPLEQWLSGWACLRGLLSVSVPVTTLSGRTMALLAPTETWAWVEEIVLLNASDGDCSRLRGCPLLDALVTLTLRRCSVGPSGLAALGELPPARRLMGLDLSQCPIGDDGVRALTASGFTALRRLDLSATRLHPHSGRHLAGGTETPFSDLEYLVLWGNDLGDAGINHLTRARWPWLRKLDLRANGIGEAGVTALAAWPGLATVRDLNLADNRLGPTAARTLADSPYLNDIASLLLWGNAIGPEGAARLRGRFGSRVHVSSGQP